MSGRFHSGSRKRPFRESWKSKSWLTLAVFFLFAACSGPADSAGSSSLFFSPQDYDFSENPELLERIKSSPHGYFRFINIAFSNEVCRRFQKALSGAAQLNLHGDAHIEQYAVTDLGRGLTDYDDSSTGPGMIDLMRFGVSLKLTAMANGWQDRGDAALDRFVAGYLKALEDPSERAAEPSIVARMRSGFTTGREDYFEWIKSIMEPVPDAERLSLQAGFATYQQAMVQDNPGLTADFFEIEELGYLRLGIGSALDKKFLVRVRGPSSEPGDDVILELKQVRNLEGIECVQASLDDPFRVLLSQARIAYKPFRFLGYSRFGGLTYWIHAWVDNYKEVDSSESFQSWEELAEVAYDVGVQLGLGHPKLIAAPFDVQVRRSQKRLVERESKMLKTACGDLTREIVQAWEKFRQGS